MKCMLNEKIIKSFNVTVDGDIVRNEDVRVSCILKSNGTAKKLVAEALGVDKNTLVVTAIEPVKQWYELDDEIFYEHAVAIPAPRAKEEEEE